MPHGAAEILPKRPPKRDNTGYPDSRGAGARQPPRCAPIKPTGRILPPGAPRTSVAENHAPATIRRRLSALGKIHRFNDLPGNLDHGDIQGRPAARAAAQSFRLLFCRRGTAFTSVWFPDQVLQSPARSQIWFFTTAPSEYASPFK